MPISTVQSFVGIGKESTKGTLVVPADFIPLKTMSLNDLQLYIDDTGLRGSQVDNYGQVLGTNMATYDMAGDVYADTIGYALAGILGDVVVAGASAPYTHTIAVKNSTDGQPVSFSITDFDGVQARAVAAAQFSDLSFLFNSEALFNFTAKAAGYISQAVATPVRSYTTVPPIANWQAIATVGGTVVPILLDGTCDIKRPVTPVHTLNATSVPYRVWAGRVAVSGKLSFITETGEAQLVNYLTNAQPALDLNFTQGTGAGLQQVKLHMSKCAYTVGLQTRGKDWVQTDITYKAAANNTDIGASAGYGQLVATLQNAKPAGTYS